MRKSPQTVFLSSARARQNRRFTGKTQMLEAPYQDMLSASVARRHDGLENDDQVPAKCAADLNISNMAVTAVVLSGS